MPLHVAIDHGTRLVQVTASAPLQLSDVLAFLDEQVSLGVWPYRTLSDYSAVEWLPSTADVQQLLSHVKYLAERHGPRGPAAIVTGKEHLATYGMARMYSIMADPNIAVIGAFLTAEEALAWLTDPAGR